MKTAKGNSYKKTKLVDYLYSNRVENQTAHHINVYLHNGQFVHTVGSMEYRDIDYDYVGRFSFYSEYAPYSFAACKRMIETL